MAAGWARDGVGKWMARIGRTGHSSGAVAFTCFDLDGEPVLELGWAVRDARTGCGYATELGRAALAWAGEHRDGAKIGAPGLPDHLPHLGVVMLGRADAV
jgi:RimJ/RimL family protein N-acetyltransferase